MRLSDFASLTLPLALFGCGNSANTRSGADDGAFAKYVAQRYDKDCRAAKAPTPDAAKQLDQICSCMSRQILSNVRDGDSNDIVNNKIDAEQQACLKQVYPNG